MMGTVYFDLRVEKVPIQVEFHSGERLKIDVIFNQHVQLKLRLVFLGDLASVKSFQIDGSLPSILLQKEIRPSEAANKNIRVTPLKLKKIDKGPKQ